MAAARQSRVLIARALLIVAALALLWTLAIVALGGFNFRLFGYLVRNDWELPQFIERFQTQRTSAVVARPPILAFRGPARIFLFDLLAARFLLQ